MISREQQGTRIIPRFIVLSKHFSNIFLFLLDTKSIFWGAFSQQYQIALILIPTRSSQDDVKAKDKTISGFDVSFLEEQCK